MMMEDSNPAEEQAMLSPLAPTVARPLLGSLLASRSGGTGQRLQGARASTSMAAGAILSPQRSMQRPAYSASLCMAPTTLHTRAIIPTTATLPFVEPEHNAFSPMAASSPPAPDHPQARVHKRLPTDQTTPIKLDLLLPDRRKHAKPGG
jgi:hypothetical protein